MAKPQAEDGHIDIANEIAEALCRINLSAYESRVLWALWRKTYGWHKKSDRISYTQWEELTGLGRWHIARTIKKLIGRNIITCRGNKYNLEYSFQKDYEQWRNSTNRHDLLPKEVTALPIGVTKKLLPLLEKPLPKEVTKSLPKEVNTKEKKETIQKKRGNALKRSTNPVIGELFKEMRSFFGYPDEIDQDPIPNYGKEGKAIKRMLDRGFTSEEILACWKAKVDKHGGNFVSMVYVNEDIRIKTGSKDALKGVEIEQ